MPGRATSGEARAGHRTGSTVVGVDDDLLARLAAVRDRVTRAALDAGRAPDEVRLLLATKTQPADTIRAAVQAHRVLAPGAPLLLGENRVAELVAKAPALADLGVPYHLIGPLQSNKMAAALRCADGIDSVDSQRLAERLAARCAEAGRTLDVMVQVNVSGEATKHGVTPDDAGAFAAEVAAMDGLHLVGFQTIGALHPDPGVVRAGYATLRSIRDEAVASGGAATVQAVELSMGMSGDLELAICEGATIVRIGTAVFGPR